jgi:hypothetical protein
MGGLRYGRCHAKPRWFAFKGWNPRQIIQQLSAAATTTKEAHAAQDRAGQGAQGSLCDALARAARSLTMIGIAAFAQARLRYRRRRRATSNRSARSPLPLPVMGEGLAGLAIDHPMKARAGVEGQLSPAAMGGLRYSRCHAKRRWAPSVRNTPSGARNMLDAPPTQDTVPLRREFQQPAKRRRTNATRCA